MNRIQRFKFLSIFGDGLEHHWFEVIFLGCQYLKIRQEQFEKEIFGRTLKYNFIQRVETIEIKTRREKANGPGIHYIANKQDYNYKITSIGDEILRNEQIVRDGDVSYYKYFNRKSQRGNDIVDYSLDHFAPLPPGLEKI